MKVTVDVRDGFDIAVVAEWLVERCPSFVQYRVIEIAWEVERSDDDPWFQFEAEFDEDSDATMFLLRWS